MAQQTERCKCYIEHGDGDVEEIVQCAICAAAPQLLAAVKDMMHNIELFYAKYREPNSPYLANLKAAIAAAEGKDK